MWQRTTVPVSVLPQEDKTERESVTTYEINAFVCCSVIILTCILFICLRHLYMLLLFIFSLFNGILIYVVSNSRMIDE